MLSSHYDKGYAMGYRHGTTGDPYDMSDNRCLPMESEIRKATYGLTPAAAFDFDKGYQEAYNNAIFDAYEGRNATR